MIPKLTHRLLVNHKGTDVPIQFIVYSPSRDPAVSDPTSIPNGGMAGCVPPDMVNVK